MFATLLGGLPRPPLPGPADPESRDSARLDALVARAIEAQEAAGFEPITDGRLRWRGFAGPMRALGGLRDTEDGAGIEAVTEILESFNVPVIFITAFPDRLLTGERPEPTYLITKPFLTETVKATIAQALFFHEAKAEPESLKAKTA